MLEKQAKAQWTSRGAIGGLDPDIHETSLDDAL
jgi:hypothetical protein